MNTFSLRLWRRAERVFEAALDHPGSPQERLAFVRRLCAGDEELLAAVEELLTLDRAETSWLEKPAVLPAALPGAVDEERSGELVGPYRLLERIGGGGMGVVYVAEASDTGATGERVAIKLLREGRQDADARRRFRRERAILAGLRHPGIARLYHGGTTDDGRPYVAMELVEGREITGYCDEHRLTIRARVALLARVARAVEFAHQNLVIHRDVKPGNILVDESGAPRLLDFGISKLLAPLASLPQDDETRAEDRLFTPQYASPEQLAGRTLTTASDVYSLGVVLYEVLAGRRPFDLGSRPLREIQKALETTRPRPPSGLFSLPPGIARPAGQARSLRRVAECRSSTPERLARSLEGDLDNILLRALEPDPADRYPSAARLADDLDSYLAGRIVTARPPTVLYRVSKFVRRNRAAVLSAAGVGVVLLGLVAGLVSQSVRVARERTDAVRERRRAEEVTRFLVDAFARASNPDGQDVTARQVLLAAVEGTRRLGGQPELEAQLLDTMGTAYEVLGLRAEMAIPLFERSLQLRSDLFGDDDPQVATSHAHLGRALAAVGDEDRSEGHLRQALALRRRHLGTRLETAESASALGHALAERGQLKEAEALIHESLYIHRRLLGEEHEETAAAYLGLARVRQKRGDSRGAVEALRKAVHATEAVHGDGVESAGLRVELGRELALLDENWEAENELRHAMATARRQAPEGHPLLDSALTELAQLLEARGELQESAELRGQLALIPPGAGGAEGDLSVGQRLIEERDYDAAEVQLADAMITRSQQFVAAREQLATTSFTAAQVALRDGRPVEAAPLAWAAMQHFSALRGREREQAEAQSLYGTALAATQPRNAETHLERALAMLEDIAGTAHPATERARDRLVRFYESQGRPEDAARYRER